MFSLKFSAQEFTGNFKRRWILLHLNVPEISHKILRCLCYTNCSENSCNKRKMRSSAYKYPANKGRRDYTVCYYKKNQNDDLLNILQESHFLLFDHDILKIYHPCTTHTSLNLSL